MTRAMFVRYSCSLSAVTAAVVSQQGVGSEPAFGAVPCGARIVRRESFMH